MELRKTVEFFQHKSSGNKNCCDANHSHSHSINNMNKHHHHHNTLPNNVSCSSLISDNKGENANEKTCPDLSSRRHTFNGNYSSLSDMEMASGICS